MYYYTLIIHSYLRYFVLISLLLSIYISINAFLTKKTFSTFHNKLRHWTATIAHIQLMLGMIVYSQSPMVQSYWKNPVSVAHLQEEPSFFGIFHASLMFISVVLITLGSAFAKRKNSDQEKFKTQFIWFSIALVVILVAIPWPFSPLVQRSLVR